VGGTCSKHGRGERCLQGFGCGVRRKETAVRPRCRWEDNIRTEIGIDGANWIRLAQDRISWLTFVNMVMNLQVP